ncbi:MAG: glucose-6-phosphate dehydrogenase, partial [Candidatus Dormiibacterota bacterium]
MGRRPRGDPWRDDVLRNHRNRLDGKRLPTTATGVMVELKQPPQRLFRDTLVSPIDRNYLRLRLEPGPAIALGARLKRPGEAFAGEQREFCLMEEEVGAESPYDRLLGDAMAGDSTLFASEAAVEAAWAVVNPILRKHDRAIGYHAGGWGPRQADALVGGGGWHNPAGVVAPR